MEDMFGSHKEEGFIGLIPTIMNQEGYVVDFRPEVPYELTLADLDKAIKEAFDRKDREWRARKNEVRRQVLSNAFFK